MIDTKSDTKSDDQTTVKNDSSGCLVSVMALLLATLTLMLVL